jgi:hypothetical protein
MKRVEIQKKAYSWTRPGIKRGDPQAHLQYVSHKILIAILPGNGFHSYLTTNPRRKAQIFAPST